MYRPLLAAALAVVALGTPVAQAATTSFKNVRCEDPANRKLIDADIRKMEVRNGGQSVPLTAIARNLSLDSIRTVGATATLLTCKIRISYIDSRGPQTLGGLYRIKALKNGQFESSFTPNY